MGKIHRAALAIGMLVFVSGCGAKNYLRDSATSLSGSSCGGMNDTACTTYNLINQERVKAGLDPLPVNQTCVQAAQDQSEDMHARGYFAHDRPAFADRPAETFAQRMGRWGIWGGENIAQNYSPEGAVQAWMGSPGHRANILNTMYRSAGMGYVAGLWTQCFNVGQ